MALTDREEFFPQGIVPGLLDQFVPGQVMQHDSAVQERGPDLVIYTKERRTYRSLFDRDDRVTGLEYLGQETPP